MADVIIDLLYVIDVQLHRYMPVVQILLGTIGNVLNIFIFMRPSLRTNPCSFYFWILSINNLHLSTIHLFTRMLAGGWNIDVNSVHSVVCKLRAYLVFVGFALSPWLIVFASIDRYFCSSQTARIRQRSNLRTAHRATLILTLILLLSYSHLLFEYAIDVQDGVSVCTVLNVTYDFYSSLVDLFVSCIIPSLFMGIFGLKTIFNLRQSRQAIVPMESNSVQNTRLRTKDRHMLVMLLMQVAAVLILTSPLTISNVYITLRDTLNSTPMLPLDFAIYDVSSDVF